MPNENSIHINDTYLSKKTPEEITKLKKKGYIKECVNCKKNLNQMYNRCPYCDAEQKK